MLQYTQKEYILNIIFFIFLLNIFVKNFTFTFYLKSFYEKEYIVELF